MDHLYCILYQMSLVAHRFGLVEFRIFAVGFFRQTQLKKIKTNIQIDASKSMSYQRHKYRHIHYIVSLTIFINLDGYNCMFTTK